MSRLFGKFFNNVRLLSLLGSIDDYIHFIKEYRKFEQLPPNYCVFKIQMIFNHNDDLAEILIKKWKHMGGNFTRFFLNLSTPNQK